MAMCTHPSIVGIHIERRLGRTLKINKIVQDVVYPRQTTTNSNISVHKRSAYKNPAPL